MERLKAWFGWRPEQNSLPTFQGSKLNTASPSDSKLKQGEITQSTTLPLTEILGQDQPVVPITEQELKPECMECKVIGCSVLSFTTLYVIYHGTKTRKNYVGYKRVMFTLQYSSLAIAMTILGISRAFNLGVFQRRKEGEDEKSLLDYFNDDIKNFKGKVEQLTSSSK